jgi:sugar porter (SP) family MFS transporter
MFASAALPSFFFVLALTTVPESPRWLIQEDRISEARGIIAKISGPEDAAEKVKQIRESIREEGGSISQLFEPMLRRPLAIAVTLAVLQQITGINTILYYGSLILIERIPQQSESASFFANVIIGLINFLCTIVAMFLIDRAGRKPLLLIAAGGMGASLTLLSTALWLRAPGWVALSLILLYVACFAVGLGPGVWIVVSEIFPTRIRGRAMSIATVCLWLACLLITSTFLSLVNALTISGAFLVYALLSFATFAFVWIYTPETKGRTLEEIERFWKKG